MIIESGAQKRFGLTVTIVPNSTLDQSRAVEFRIRGQVAGQVWGCR
jgi:hypothetical protein